MKAPIMFAVALLAVSLGLVAGQSNAGLVRHYVAFKYTENTTLAQQAYFFDKLLLIQYKCLNKTTGLPYIIAEDGGYSDSPEGFNDNMTQGFIFTFASFEVRDYFFTEETVHLAYIKEITPHLAGIFMLDYEIVPVNPPANAIVAKPQPSTTSGGIWHHYVAWKYLPNVTADEQQQLLIEFLQLQYLCKNPETGNLYILSLDGGYSNGTAATDDGMTNAFILTFGSMEDRDYFIGQPLYTPYEPLHQAYKDKVRPLLTGIYAMDYSPVAL